MPLSMTGYGDARAALPTGAATVEVRSVNNRHLKVTVRGSEPYPMLDADVERVVRKHVKRGTLLVMIRVERTATAANARLNTALLATYIEQLHHDLAGISPEDRTALIGGLLALPGVAPEAAVGAVDDEWPGVEKTLETALVNLNQSRKTEGAAMAAELAALAKSIGTELTRIRSHLPQVTASYRQRMLDRVRQALADSKVTLEPEQIIREVALFADRSDVAEEMTRLASHLDSFHDMLASDGESPGRRLEFVVQEMGREANTLGSKAGDVIVSRHVVEIKAALERIRELVQNIE